MDHATYALKDPGDVCSPALIFYRDLIKANTRAAIEVAGDAGRLWPHVKSHKMADMVKMQMAMGIERFKCATIAELNMAAACGPRHLLMAYPLVGPNAALFLNAMERHPGTQFYALGDSIKAMELLSRAASARGLTVRVLADVNLGMDRTGVGFDRLADFYRACARLPGISPAGLHCYDGHVHEADLADRRDRAAPPLRRALDAAAALAAEGREAVVRLKMPREGQCVIQDRIRGEVR
ncbi:MAG: hypothetical protein GX558_00665, partial [Clostridiales bacterium]|nr:hypothetical protein [Clostridiales bacterium]